MSPSFTIPPTLMEFVLSPEFVSTKALTQLQLQPVSNGVINFVDIVII